MDDHVVIGLFQIPREHFCTEVSRRSTSIFTLRTIAPSIQVDDAPNAHIDDAQKALVLLLELLLVKDLNGQHAVLGNPPGEVLAGSRGDARVRRARAREREHVHVEALVPVGVQRLLDHARGPRLFATDGGNRKGIWEACLDVSTVPGELRRWDARKTSRL